MEKRTVFTLFMPFLINAGADVSIKNIIAIFFITMASCNTNDGWQVVTYNEAINDNRLGTECVITHQGEHEVGACDVYVDGDTLVICFPAELPGYWGSATVKVFEGKFNDQFDGIQHQ